MKNTGVFSIYRFIFFFLFLAELDPVYGQQVPRIEWQKCLGGKYSEDSVAQLNSHSIIQTHDGGCIIAGSTQSDNGNVSGNHGGNDAWIVKLDYYGNIDWQKCYGGTSDDAANCIIETSDGYMFCGWTASNDGDVSGNHGGASDAWVVKIDFSGNIRWQKCLGGRGWERFHSIICTSDGGYALAGLTSSHEEGFFNNAYQDAFEQLSNAYIVKLNGSGDIEWQRCFGGSGPDVADAILQTSDGEYIFAGGTDSTYHGMIPGNHGASDVWVVKINSSGDSVRWQKCFGGSDLDGAWTIIHTFDGGYLIGGDASSPNDGDVSGHHDGLIFGSNNFDEWVLKIDSVGNLLWQKCLGGSKSEYARSIVQTPDSGYIVLGYTESDDGDVSGQHGINFSSDIWLVKLSPSGSLLWQKCYGGTGDEEGYSIALADKDKYFVYGRTNSNDGDVAGNHGGYDEWIIKLDAVMNSIENSSNAPSFSWIYPNPATDEVFLNLYLTPVKQVRFYNIMGVQYFPSYQIQNYVAAVDVHSLPTGSYIMNVSYYQQGNNLTEQVQKFLHYK